MPDLADFTQNSSGSLEEFTDGTEDDTSEEDTASGDYAYSGSDSSAVTADTSALESALESASDELAELQSDLASEKKRS